MEPLSQIGADAPDKFAQQWVDIIPASGFKDNGMNHGLSRAGSLMIFVSACALPMSYRCHTMVLATTLAMTSPCRTTLTFKVGSCLVAVAFIFGFIKARIFFLIAASCSGLGALLLLMYVVSISMYRGKADPVAERQCGPR